MYVWILIKSSLQCSRVNRTCKLDNVSNRIIKVLLIHLRKGLILSLPSHFYLTETNSLKLDQRSLIFFQTKLKSLLCKGKVLLHNGINSQCWSKIKHLASIEIPKLSWIEIKNFTSIEFETFSTKWHGNKTFANICRQISRECYHG